MGRIILIIALAFGVVAGFGHGIARVAGWRGHGPCAAYRHHAGWHHGPPRAGGCPCAGDRAAPPASPPASPGAPKK